LKEELDIDQRKNYGLICSFSTHIGLVRGISIPASMHFSLYRFPELRAAMAMILLVQSYESKISIG